MKDLVVLHLNTNHDRSATAISNAGGVGEWPLVEALI